MKFHMLDSFGFLMVKTWSKIDYKTEKVNGVVMNLEDHTKTSSPQRKHIQEVLEVSSGQYPKFDHTAQSYIELKIKASVLSYKIQ